MLASMRHFLRFIDLDKEFDAYGFKKKVGAAFKLNGRNREGYTDFLASGGADNYAWNVIRSEADEILFKHAGKSGASMHDGVKVNEIYFDNSNIVESPSAANGNLKSFGRPTSASYTNSSTGASGTIKFDYLIDASGRAGILTSKYLKSRKFNQGLKNLANWGYWKNTGAYAVNTARADSPYFEALTGIVFLLLSCRKEPLR
jgi:flavin-dependent dehydrogenase